MMFDCGLQNIFQLKNGQSRSCLLYTSDVYKRQVCVPSGLAFSPSQAKRSDD